MKALIAWLRLWAWKYVGTLFMSPSAGGQMAVSLGRLAFVAVLCQFFWIWHKAGTGAPPAELPPGLMDVFLTTAGYVFGTKIIDAVKGKGGAPTGEG